MGLYSVSRERRTDFYPADHSNHCALTAKVRLQVDHVYGSAFACRHMHVTWPDGHISGAYPYKYTHAHTHIGMYVHCTASCQLRFKPSDQPLLNSWFPLTLKTALHLGSIYFLQTCWYAWQELACTGASEHPHTLDQRCTRFSSWLLDALVWREGWEGRMIAPALQVASLQLPLVQEILESDIAQIRL